jgi:hypothetical protein
MLQLFVVGSAASKACEFLREEMLKTEGRLDTIEGEGAVEKEVKLKPESRLDNRFDTREEGPVEIEEELKVESRLDIRDGEGGGIAGGKSVPGYWTVICPRTG